VCRKSQTGHEGMFKVTKAEVTKRVWVIGGGPGGMKAAETASLRGHEVTLYERSEHLGDVSLWQPFLPGKRS